MERGSLFGVCMMVSIDEKIEGGEETVMRDLVYSDDYYVRRGSILFVISESL